MSTISISDVPANVQAFVRLHAAGARKVERETGLAAVFALAQAGMESGWGASSPGNNFHGIKAFASWKGGRRLSRTWEATKDGKLNLQVGESTIRIYKPGEEGNPFGKKYYAHRIMAWFRTYPTPFDSFKDHAALLQRPRYAKAWAVRDNPDKMAVEIMAAGYGTDPGYVPKLQKAIKWVEITLGKSPAKDGGGGSGLKWLIGLGITGLLTAGIVTIVSSERSK